MADWWLQTLGSNAATSLALACLALFVASRTRRPALAHVLWVLVLAKLIAPPVMKVSVEVQSPPMLESMLAVVASATESPAAISRMAGHLHLRDFLPHLQSWLPSAELMVTVWLSGAVLCAGWYGVCLWRLQHELSRGTRDEHAQRLADRLARSLGLAASPSLVFVDSQRSPLLCGVGPWLRVVFPLELWNRLSPGARSSLLVHELAHYRRRDHLVRVLELAAICLGWWFPLVWWVRRRLQIAEEQCCDAWVAEVYGQDRRTYAEALLSTLDFVSERRGRWTPLSTGLGDVPFLKQRLTQIMQQNVAKRLSTPWRVICLVVCSVAIVAHPLLVWVHQPSLAQSTDDSAQIFVGGGIANELAGIRTTRETALSPLPMHEEPRIVSSRSDDASSVNPAGSWPSVHSPNGRFELQTDSNSRLLLRDSHIAKTYDLSSYRIERMAFLGSGEQFLAGCVDGRVMLFDAARGVPVTTLGTHGGAVRALATSPDGTRAATGARDGEVMLWNLTTGVLVTSRIEWQRPVTALRFSSDGKLLAIATGDWRFVQPSEITITDGEGLKTKRKFGITSVAAALEFGRNDERVLTTNLGGRAQWHSLATGELLTTGQLPPALVRNAAFSEGIRLQDHLLVMDEASIQPRRLRRFVTTAMLP